MRVPMKAKKGLTYATRQLKAGDPFEAHSRTDARILRAIGKAEPVDSEALVPPLPAPAPDPEKPKRKRRKAARG